MGFNVKNSFKKNPEIADAYALYVMCRGQSIAVYKAQKGKSTMQVLAPYTTGLQVLPEPGGVQDQPHRLMTFFDEFIDGERHAFFNPRH